MIFLLEMDVGQQKASHHAKPVDVRENCPGEGSLELWSRAWRGSKALDSV